MPLVLATLLAAALVFQMLAVDEPELPATGPIGGGLAAAPLSPRLPPTAGGAGVAVRSLFSPSAVQSAASDGSAPASPLGGYAVIGSVQVGRVSFAVVQRPGGKAGYVRLGGRIGDWQLLGLTRTEAVLARGKKRLTVPFDSRGVTAAYGAGGSR